MSNNKDIRVPDIGDFTDVEIIEVLVAEGDNVALDDGLVTLETDKASMDVPASHAGKIVELKVGQGDRVSEGDLIAVVAVDAEESPAESAEDAGKDDAEAAAQPAAVTAPAPGVVEPGAHGSVTPEPAPVAEDERDYDHDLLVLGAGPGGYTAAFRAADLGREVTLIERWDTLGGVCLNVGCIPSKALLHAAEVIEEAAHMSEHGIVFGTPKIELDKLRGWKEGVVGRLTKGLGQMAKQ
ncbi:MAG: FAD-dependent oxidoreductase, partial [Gammaproteobacteria bacterium]